MSLNLSMFMNVCVSTIEYIARFVFVNIPSYVLSLSPELDRICACIFAYLILQVVGFIYAFLVNAAFAMASSTLIYSYFPHFLKSIGISINETGSDTTNSSYQPYKLDEAAPDLTQFIAIFYVYIASIRVVIQFGQSVFHMALESIKDFPDLAKSLCINTDATLQIYPVIFIPTVILEAVLLISDNVCTSNSDSGSSTIIQDVLCSGCGFNYFTFQYPEMRRLSLISLVVMVVQLYQIFLFQFAHWDSIINTIEQSFLRVLLQISIIIIVILTAVAITFIYTSASVSAEVIDKIIGYLLICWTLWLFAFIPILTAVSGDVWKQSFTPQFVESMMAYLRFSNLAILGCIFFSICFISGILNAQFDLTISTIVIPAVYCLAYLISSLFLRYGSSTLTILVPVSIIVSWIVTSHCCGRAGQGSSILVFAHVLSKLCSWWPTYDDVDDDSHDIGVGDARDSTGKLENNDNSDSAANTIMSDEARFDTDSMESTIICDVGVTNDLIYNSIAHQPSMPSLRYKEKSSSSDTLTQLLSKKGLSGSRHVRIPLLHSDYVTKHSIRRLVKRNLKFVGKIGRKAVSSGTFITFVIRFFTAFAIFMAIGLCSISIFSFAQQSLQYFPSLISFETTTEGSYHFNHIIANLTLHPSPATAARSKFASGSGRSSGSDSNSSSSGGRGSGNGTCSTVDEHSSIKTILPTYASCNMHIHGLTLLDYSILSELAYIGGSSEHMQQIVDTLFPQYSFNVHILDSYGRGPVFLELSDAQLNTTILAIRGTDVGRLHDFMEDIKLYTEPVIFSMLSTVFPTIACWTAGTTSKVIEWLYEFNTFFGLQGML